MANSDTFQFSKLEREELPGIGELFWDFPTGVRSEKSWKSRFTHWWEANPAFSNLSSYGAKVSTDNRVVGIICTIPIRIWLSEKEAIATIRSTWRVLKEFRSQSVPLILFSDSLFLGAVNLNGTPIDSILPLLKYCGWTLIRDHIEVTVIAASLVAVGRRVLSLPNRLVEMPRFICPDRTVDVEAAMASADATWQATRHLCKHGPVRDSLYYRWYALENPTMPFTWFFIPGEHDEKGLFALATHYDDGSLHVMDFWPWNAPDASFKKMIRLIVKTARKHSFSVIRVPHFSTNIGRACGSFRLSRNCIAPQRFYMHLPKEMELPADGVCWPLNCGDIGI
ncbi:hypothetical protein [Prosthecobacter sp.]|uniref:hypothetical protein n=1 Tax=Prosthecobacter sp. TaxID=1965333 RepID=UPI0024880627|nr:hypothetical protein [Prosthecobacter sp.]MDI1310854.1 hypothetical protein [Prosthecobacter sp.]